MTLLAKSIADKVGSVGGAKHEEKIVETAAKLENVMTIVRAKMRLKSALKRARACAGRRAGSHAGESHDNNVQLHRLAATPSQRSSRVADSQPLVSTLSQRSEKL